MWLVVSHPKDTTSQRLVESWSSGPAAMLTASDLSRPGWQHFPAGGGRDTLAIAGRQLPVEAITGVLTRIAAVTEHDLPHIVGEDRHYVALEMTAFLRSWLSGLKCPVLNRPTTTSLMGPGWSAYGWRVMAQRAGLRVAERDGFGADAQLVALVGEQCLGTESAEIADAVRRLARAAHVELLGLRFSSVGPGAQFLGVEPWFDVARSDIAKALRAHFATSATEVSSAATARALELQPAASFEARA